MRALVASASLVLLVSALWAAPASAAGAGKKRASPGSAHTKGLGRSCKTAKECRSKAQTCLHDEDANGKLTSVGFCALPCLSFEAGTTKVVEGAPLDPATAKLELNKKAPPRCPPHYQCRSAGSGVPIDMCVKE